MEENVDKIKGSFKASASSSSSFVGVTTHYGF